jgi:hypothetical protein
MYDVASTVLAQLVRSVQQAPGWFPLTVVCYLLFVYAVPQNAAVLEVQLAEHKELLVGAVVLILYLIGDAIDKPAWEHFEPKRYLDHYRRKARAALVLEGGIYSPSFFRSAVMLSLVVGVALIPLGSPVWGTLAIVAAPILLFIYIRLKTRHMRDLYELSECLSTRAEYRSQDLPNGIRLFFWDGQFVASGSPPTKHA